MICFLAVCCHFLFFSFPSHRTKRSDRRVTEKHLRDSPPDIFGPTIKALCSSFLTSEPSHGEPNTGNTFTSCTLSLSNFSCFLFLFYDISEENQSKFNYLKTNKVNLLLSLMLKDSLLQMKL